MAGSIVGRAAMAATAACICAFGAAAPSAAQASSTASCCGAAARPSRHRCSVAGSSAFAKVEPGLSVDYDSIGSGEGMSRFVTGSLDFAGTDAPLSPTDAAMVEDGVLQLPLAGGMIAICYNIPGFTGELRLPRDVYAGIFDGTITAVERPADRCGESRSRAAQADDRHCRAP